MAEIRVLSIGDLPHGAKKVVQAGDTKILLINEKGKLLAVQPECPHAGAPLEEGAVCDGRLICPWHLATFNLSTGELLEPPAMEPLKTYAVRTEGEDVLVNTEPLPLARSFAAQPDAGSVFLLVGAGAAGAMAAATLRQSGFRGRIVVVDPVQDEPVDRTQLSKDALGSKMPLDKVKLDVFSDLSVERINASVVRLNAEKRHVHLDNGEIKSFDKALVATGGKPNRLEMQGAELAHTIRHSDDVKEILDALEGKTRVVIVGTSFIGLEAASALVQKGLWVTVVGREKLPFAKQFGEKVAHALKRLHESNGTKFQLSVEPIISERGVAFFEDGEVKMFFADVVIMGVGVSPELGFEHDLPLAEGGGIQTDESLRAKATVWVAGDIANVNGQRIEHWRVAQQHGRTAALAMMGCDATYAGVPFFWTYHFGKRLGYLGHAKEWDETVIKGDLEGDEFMVLYIQGELVKAVLNCGFETQMAALAEPMRGKLTLDEALRRIA